MNRRRIGALVLLAGLSSAPGCRCGNDAAPPAAAPPVSVEVGAAVDAAGGPPAPADVAAPPAEAQRTKSGIASVVLAPARAGVVKLDRRDRVRARWVAWRPDGTYVGASQVPEVEIQLNGAGPGWSEVLGLVARGERRRVWVPQSVPTVGLFGLPATGPLTLDIEVLEEAGDLPRQRNLAPPPGAKTTPGGVAWVLLTEGPAGGKTPEAGQRVAIEYVLWRADGTPWDGTPQRGQPSVVRPMDLSPGFMQLLLEMKPGDRARAWIPGRLGYGDKPTATGVPAGALVLEVRLLERAP